MKLLLRTEGLPGADVFTEVEREDIPDEIILRYEPKVSIFNLASGNTCKVLFKRVGNADGMPYYKR